MSANLFPKSKLCFLKANQLKQSKRSSKIETPKTVQMQLLNSQNDRFKSDIKELQDELKRSQEANEKKDRELQAVEDDLLTVLIEVIKTKKENDYLKTQLRMKRCVNECEM